MKNKRTILIATGGTGGHVFPSIGLGNYLSKDYNIEIFTDKRGLKFFGNDQNFKITNILSSRVLGKNIINFFTGIVKVLISTILSVYLLIKIKPKLVIGMGGYASFPVCLAGYFLRVPLIIYENNLVIGRANKLLLPFTKKILVSTNSIQGINNKYKFKIFYTGFLLRNKILNVNKLNDGKTKKNLSILIMGGSQSAEAFGNEIPKIIKKCNDAGIKFNIFQQCLDYQKMNISNIYESININFKLFNYIDNLKEYYQNCDIAITRCGASSLAELVNLKTPFIAIPLPTSIDNHQLINAKYFQNKGFCFLLEQKNLSEKLFDMLKTMHEDRDMLDLFKKKMSKHTDKDSLLLAKKIIKETINV